MAVAFSAVGSIGVDSANAFVDVVAPTLVGGEIIICSLLGKDNIDHGAPASGGWTEIGTQTNNTTAQTSSHWWKLAVLADSGATFRFTKATDNNIFFAGVIHAWTGAHTTSPIDATAPTVSNNALSDTVTYADFNPAVPCTVVAVGIYNEDLTTAGSISGTNPTFVNDFDLETGTGTDCSFFGYSGESDGAATGARSHSTSSMADAINQGWLFGLVPAPTYADAVHRLTEQPYFNRTLIVPSAEKKSGIIIGAGFDTDASDLISIANINNSVVATAVNNLILSAKGNAWWTLCNAIYGMAGANAHSHKFNWKDPRDLDAAFRLNFQGTWVHSATGAKPDGSTAYADTFIKPSVNLLLNDAHLSYYSRENTAFGSSYDVGALDGTSTKEFALILRRSGDTAFSIIHGEGAGEFVSPTVTDSRGFFMGSRVSSTDHTYYKNGSSIGTATAANTSSLGAINIYLACLNLSGTASSFGDKECALATIGAGVNSEIARLMNGDIKTYQNALGRAV